jgi:hypothetical protein
MYGNWGGDIVMHEHPGGAQAQQESLNHVAHLAQIVPKDSEQYVGTIFLVLVQKFPT